MEYREFGRLGWQVSEIGYGMWGMGEWTGSDDSESQAALEEAVRLGCNFFDTAWAYGEGHSEKLLGALVRAHPETRLYLASKIPPKNRTWPSRRGFTLDEVFPPDHIRDYAHRSLENLGSESIDLLQFHVWEDAWATDERWQHRHGSPGHGRDHVLPAFVPPYATLPVLGGQLMLGVWQSLCLVDPNGDNPERQVRFSFLPG